MAIWTNQVRKIWVNRFEDKVPVYTLIKINLIHAKLSHLNFDPLKVESRYRDPPRPTVKSHLFSHFSLTLECLCDRSLNPKHVVLTLTTLKYICINHGDQRVFQFEIIINVLVSSFWFIWIPMLWVYDDYKYFNSFSAGTVFKRETHQRDCPRDVALDVARAIGRDRQRDLFQNCCISVAPASCLTCELTCCVGRRVGLRVGVETVTLLSRLSSRPTSRVKSCSRSRWCVLTFIRQSLKSTHGIFWRIMTVPALKRITEYKMC